MAPAPFISSASSNWADYGTKFGEGKKNPERAIPEMLAQELQHLEWLGAGGGREEFVELGSLFGG